MKKLLLTTFLIGPPLSTSLHAAITVNYANDPGSNTYLLDYSGVRLSAGAKGAGDGALVEFGYYSMGTTGSPFQGTWITLDSTTIGDGVSDAPGRFLGSESFVSSTPGMPLPVRGTQLVIRFYDGQTTETSSHYNAVALAQWEWPTSDGSVSLILYPFDFVWEGGSGSAYRTTIAVVPEVSVSMLSLISVGLALSRRRRAKTGFES